MKISRPTGNEYATLVDLWESSVSVSHGFLTEKDLQYYKPLIIKEYLPAVEIRYAKSVKGDILGFIGVAESNVEMLFVAPEYFGKGVGRFLLQHAIDELGAVKVDVNEQNHKARAFYEHMGFVITGRSPVDSQGKPYPLLHLTLCNQGS